MLVAAACVIALVLGTGGWIIYANDFAIREERLTIPGSVQPLQATLALPKDGNGPFGLVVFIHGDGPADATRDGFYKPIWESFAKAGYASLSWNKPGIGGPRVIGWTKACMTVRPKPRQQSGGPADAPISTLGASGCGESARADGWYRR
ncbi:hydrolase family protein [Mycobacteroides abscessus MAB_030201_1075]|uniref:Hydrolase family protein n=1 Tax=Mycobacteroides abscessus MAB_030201_1075 TaxID=1335410 RepID=A0A829PMK5_9MYCO|nr:hydrolase family protein [Mycobacteroides abscessus MAB_030201_1075]